MYVAADQESTPPSGTYIVRGTRISGSVDSVLKRVDSKLVGTDVRTLYENLSRSILRARILGTLSGLFGVLSLNLVSVGVYGVMAFQVARRQKEIGSRMALGARPIQITGLVLAETAVPVALGVAMGMVSAFGLTRLAKGMLYDVSPTDPITFGGASAILILLALLAACVPVYGLRGGDRSKRCAASRWGRRGQPQSGLGELSNFLHSIHSLIREEFLTLVVGDPPFSATSVANDLNTIPRKLCKTT